MRASLEERIRGWSAPRKSVNWRIFRDTLTVGSLTLLVKVAGAAKVMAMAASFGTGDALDAFLIAFLLPTFIAEVAAASLNAALIPTLIQVREREGIQAARRLFSGVMLCTCLFLLALSLLLLPLARVLLSVMGSGFPPHKLDTAQSLFQVMLPVIVLSGFSATWRATLNASHRFALAAAAPVMTPLAMIAFLIAAGDVWGPYALAWGAVTGTALEAALAGFALKLQRFSLMPRWHGIDWAMTQVGRQWLPLAAGAVMMSGVGVVDQAMAAMLGAGSVAALSYGHKVVAVIHAIGPAAVSTAALPPLSRLVAREEFRQVRHTMRTYFRLALLVSVPVTLALAMLSEPIASLLYERGAFTSSDTRLVARIQSCYLVQIPISVLSLLVIRLISSLKQNHLLLRAAAVDLCFHVIFNLLLMRWLGVAGIALSTAAAHLVSFAYLLRALSVSMPREGA